jgi:hypothetical protein
MGGVIYALSIGVAFLSAYAFLAVQAALAIYYAFDPLSRRAGLAPVSTDDVPDTDDAQQGPFAIEPEP